MKILRSNENNNINDLVFFIPLICIVFLVFFPLYYKLSTTLWLEENYSHSPIILCILIWLFLRKYKELNSLPYMPENRLASVLFFISAVFYILGKSQSIPAIEIVGHIIIIATLILYFKGMNGLRLCRFLLFFMLFLIPIPGLILYSLTSELKELVSILSENILFNFGYPIARAGVTIAIGQYQLLVADACSGMNSIISLSALGFLYIHLNNRSCYIRNWIIVLLLIPIAFVANVIRVCLLILLTYHFGNDVGQGYAHSLAGFVLFSCSLLMIYFLDELINFFNSRSKV